MLEMAYLPRIVNENLLKTFSKGNGVEYEENCENKDMKIEFTASQEKKSLNNSMWTRWGRLVSLHSRILKEPYLKPQVSDQPILTPPFPADIRYW